MNKQVSAWLKIARRDLFGAEYNLKGSDELLAFAGYLAQQSVEKVIKAFLTFHKIKFSKTHNIAVLLEKVRERDSELEKSISRADELTDFATRYRYPEAIEKELTRKEVEEAFQLAKLICDRVLSALSESSGVDPFVS